MNPLSPLLKIGNPKLFEQFEEMQQFLLDFDMGTNDVNDIIAYHIEAMHLNLSAHDQWIHATRKWLKESTNSTQIWHQDIVRYDCIFDGDRNCGFNYYYENVQDAVEETNAMDIGWYEAVAGRCS